MRLKLIAGAVLTAALTGAASATVVGIPVDGGLGLQEAVTPVMENIVSFHNLLLWIISAICLLVLGLIAWIVVRYRAKSNPVAKKFSHNTLIEIIWTAVPVLILIVIAVPSFRLLYFQDVIPEADFTIKVTGNQWNWTYEYPDHGGFEFVSNMLEDDAITSENWEQARLLSTDVPIVVPSGATVRVQVTASDVIHSWAVPAFGVKMDGIPGRLNETWFLVPEGNEGIYFGQCSEICGIRHAFMPIEVHVVPEEVFTAWTEAANADPYTASTVLASYYASQRATRVAAAN
ncbi:MAG: cytochrome c oxidase subunit II [Caulobacterales bacterium]|uniref:cytochrome c oxidase subunit II n=1 Tax=Glycocaulis sp. TaxID=1969725 RepID=UPI003FA14983